MTRSLALALTVTLLNLAGTLTPTSAQTGPATADAVAAVKAANSPATVSRLTSQRLATLLRRDGHRVQTKTLSNGAEMVVAAINRDGWRFVVEFEFSVNGNNFNLICPLGNAASQFSGEQLLALMRKSYELPCPMHFSYRAGDKRLCLEDPSYNASNVTDALVRSIVDRLVNTVRQTHPLWDSSRWPQPAVVGKSI